MRRLALLATAATLCACQPHAVNAPAANATDAVSLPSTPEPTPMPVPMPATPPKAAADYHSELRLVGTEPFWGVAIKPDRITLTRPDHPDLTAPNPGVAISGETARWTANGLTVELKPADCSDGMSDRAYPYAATVTVGSEVLKGCAMRADGPPLTPR